MDALIQAARDAQQHAHAPYSGFRVAAALETDDGQVFAGVNVENASYGLTMCAERVAVGAAVTAGSTGFRRIVVVTDAPHPVAPCGACRQVLAEFGTDMIVDGVAANEVTRWTMGELLPDGFGGKDLAAT